MNKRLGRKWLAGIVLAAAIALFASPGMALAPLQFPGDAMCQGLWNDFLRLQNECSQGNAASCEQANHVYSVIQVWCSAS